jgi:hypothetical protein
MIEIRSGETSYFCVGPKEPRVTKREVAPWREEAFLSHWFTELARTKGVCPRGDLLFQRLREDWDWENAARLPSIAASPPS